MTSVHRTRTVLLATIGLWLASILAFGLGLAIPLAKPLPTWIYGWLATLPIPGIPLSLLIYRQAVRWEGLSSGRRWSRLAPLFLGLATVQATVDHFLYVLFDHAFGPRTPITASHTLSGVLFNLVIYVWLFGLFTVVVEMILAIERATRLQRAEAVARAEARDAQLELLRGQLNPHFLFNTLNNLSGLVVSERLDEADKMIAQLARYLRFSLEHQGSERLSLRKEVEFLRAYLEIEAMRFPVALTFSADLPADAHDIAIPALLLQPLVEGLVREAVAPAHGDAEIHLKARSTGAELSLELIARRRGQAGTPLDLADRLDAVRSRLSLLYGEAGGVSADGLGEGRVEIRLPRGEGDSISE